MLSKSKSKQILKFKYALLIPLIFGMLIYSSCAYEAEAPEQNVELDLSQFTYTLKLDEKMSNEKKAIHEKYEAFLKSNAEYVSWANIDKVNNEITYTVHSKAEAVPDGFTSSEVGFPDGSSYISYMNMSYFDFASKSDSDSLRKKQDNISFQTIDWSPTWNSCQSYTDNESRKKCTVQSISKFVNHNFNLKISEETGLTGVQRISALFNIDKNGEVTDIKVRAPHPDLEREVKRVISAFPKFSPGKNKGEFVEVGYSLPIMFKLQ